LHEELGGCTPAASRAGEPAGRLPEAWPTIARGRFTAHRFPGPFSAAALETEAGYRSRPSARANSAAITP
jgi:hypothetical protein